ncbi:PPE family protein [Mycobacterium sp. IS-1556]|uniref:PPE family protein n=1 Tax=Mycobacterium sp. IS-1556 TaxID=1772276 RepID=UPI000B31880B|nr:PPE family protein [Mycobacterium sp. IS-1556]
MYSWHGMPPEINTARLMAGAGPAPMLQAAAGWEAFAISLETQADELAASLANLASMWTGAASERAVAATMPMIVWLRTVSAQAQKRALQATAQANSYSLAMATTPPLMEIVANHVTRAVLHATNFLGVNTVPIGINEFDYFVRMWNQAAGAMDVYQAETALNIMFEPIMPMKPIVIPGVGEAGAASAIGQVAGRAVAGAARNAVIAKVSAWGKVETARLSAGSAVANADSAAQRAQGQVQKTENAAQQAGRQQTMQQGMQQGMQMGMQMASQLGSTLGQLPQQGMQMVSQPMQQLTQPLQQVTSMFSQLGSVGSDKAQIGLIGASPFSNHPLAGGSGAASGAGLVRAASLPGAGGIGAQTPLMANLIGETKPVAVAPGAAAGGSAAGLAPVGAGGMGPMGAMGQRGTSGGSKQGLNAPRVLPQDLGEDEGDDW